MEALEIREAGLVDGPDGDRAARRWILEASAPIGGPVLASGGRLHDLARLPALVAMAEGRPAGFAAFRHRGAAAELVALLAAHRGRGIGSALLAAAEAWLGAHGACRLTVFITNDNLDALRFYQRRGFVLERLEPGGFAAVARLKGLDPEAPYTGRHGIAIRDMLRLGKALRAPED